MNTIIEKYTADTIKKAGEILKAGGLVAFPTETVYGLGADALDEKASAKIYEAKGRPSDNPLIVHIAEMDSLYEVAEEIPDTAIKLAKEMWPGPLTMIFKKKEVVPLGTTGGLESVAVRMPDSKPALDLIKAGGGFVAAPSANLSGRPSPTSASHVADDLNGRIDMIIDGGNVEIGIESTIVDFTCQIPMILRPGHITQEEIRKVIGNVIVDPGITSKPDENVKPKAPGMKYRHYAPKADMEIVKGSPDLVVSYVNDKTKELHENFKRCGIICTNEQKFAYNCDIIKTVGDRGDEEAIAHNLYRVLREFDEANVDYIFSECFDEGLKGLAIMNRLLKAAGYKVINV